jgi:1,4-alpha-glucan branching enzyme
MKPFIEIFLMYKPLQKKLLIGPVSKPIYDDGLGFGMKWMMGWMHDTLDYFKIDPILQAFHQNKFTFSMMYFYDENFMLPLSHDEVVHGKSPMIYKMPGDDLAKICKP